MNRAFVLAAFLIICAAPLAEEPYDQCLSQEKICMEQCCDSAGGTFTLKEGDVGNCKGDAYTDEAVGASYLECASSECTPAAFNCAAPGSNCEEEYSSCYNSCKPLREGTESCKNGCSERGISCVEEYLAGKEGTSCCGGFALAFGLLGFLFWKNQ